MKKLFLSYQNESAQDISALAQELRYRGVIPWVDKLPGGFKAGDVSEQEARRVIREDCFALLLYLTPKVLGSDFIKTIEVPEAARRQRLDSRFKVVVASPCFGFGEMKRMTLDAFGIDLTPVHGYKKGDDEENREFFERIAREMTHRLLTLAPVSLGSVEISVNTYERMPHGDEALYFDATQALQGDVTRTIVWSSLLEGLQDAKQELSALVGRPHTVVSGSKHLTAAFMVGRVFNQYPLSIRQKDEFWQSVGEVDVDLPLTVTSTPGAHVSGSLVVEFATGYKTVSAGVDVLVAKSELVPGGRLQIRPATGKMIVTDSLSRSLAHSVYREIEKECSLREYSEIHFFTAAPQATVMTIATLFQGMPDVVFYEWTVGGYIPTVRIPGRLR